jgi:hypothetical protein
MSLSKDALLLEYELGCHVERMVRRKMHIKLWSGEFKRKYYFGDLGAGIRIIHILSIRVLVAYSQS